MPIEAKMQLQFKRANLPHQKLFCSLPRVIGTGRVRANEELGPNAFSLLFEGCIGARSVYLSGAAANSLLCFSEKRQEEGGGDVLT
jgi:hypothetical protein